MSFPHEFNTRFLASEFAVREALNSVIASLRESGLHSTDIGQVEIVLAETLNNVVEHAYADAENGPIELRLKHQPKGIDITILDHGISVPVHVFAKRTGPEIDVDLDALPEGGFGWMLIQKMTSHLSYQRVGNTNCLRMTIPLENAA